MPISAALCSGKVQGVADEYSFNPKVHALTMNWFGFNSIHSLYWLTIYKTISILMLFRNGQLFTPKCFYIIFGIIWIVGCSLATLNITVKLSWNIVLCSHRTLNVYNVKAVYMTYFVFGIVLPVSIIVYALSSW